MRLLGDPASKILVNVASGPDLRYPVLGWPVLQTHGDQMGSGGGQGFAGPDLPIVRGSKKIQLSAGAIGEQYHLILSAHYHTSSNPGSTLANGSIVGYPEYIQTLRAAPDVPRQWLGLIHEKWGLRERMPIALEDPPKPDKIRIKVPVGTIDD